MKNIVIAFISFLFMACANYRDIPYFQNSKDFKDDGTVGLYDIKIKPKDELVIFVSNPTNSESVAQFNARESTPMGEVDQSIGGIRLATRYGRRHRYLVENDGTIDFPIVGRIHLAGLTIEQANAAVLEKVLPYLQDNSNCIVNTYIGNYEISVLGEVKRPNTFTIDRNKCTILEALAMAGDMTIYGKRDNVKLLRELPDGTYGVHELDMRDANILNSPYYYLQQRDIVYVEPNEAMLQNSQVGTTTRLWVRGVAISISLGSLLYRVLN
jgi:polysaccharide export outer membrane protein